MASFTGLIYAGYDLGGEAPNGQSTTNPELFNPYMAGVAGSSFAVVNPTNHAGKSLQGTPREVIFEQIYFSPTEIDLGFIGDDSVHNVDIWNAFLADEKNLTQLQIVNQAGTSHNVPSLPVIIRPNTEKQYQITVSKSGAAVQLTSYLFTIGSDLFEIVITGKRITAFPFEPDWTDVKVKYRFNTVINRNKRFKEQRRSLLVQPSRKITATFFCDSIEQEKFVHLTKQFMFKTLGVPIFPEPMTPTIDLVGLTTIPVSETLAEYYNMQNYTDLILVKSISTLKTEIKEIASLGANSITVSSAVIENFTAGDTIIFPIFIGIIENTPQFELFTDNTIRVSLELKEVAI